ncbi:DNA-binding response OmpR family regulator [Desulfitispora alkaliphila]|uniref:response regulator transcription factor n=1 Tax=Desulfitispora alkaliphila TaxID=622674 RepID=UPI003D1EF338
MALKILVVDDEPLIIEVLKAYLERDGYQVFSAITGSEALSKIETIKPDFLVLDLMLPDISGEKLCKQVRQTSDIPIIMLTAKTAEEDRIQGIVIGADDYISKPFSPREVVVRIQAILRRTQRLTEKDRLSFNNGALIIDLPRYQAFMEKEELELTPIEFKLLAGMAKYPGRVYTRSDLLEKVQQDTYEGYERSIDVHIKNLRKKVEKNSKKPEYIITVFGIGYKFGGKPDVTHSSQ